MYELIFYDKHDVSLKIPICYRPFIKTTLNARFWNEAMLP